MTQKKFRFPGATVIVEDDEVIFSTSGIQRLNNLGNKLPDKLNKEEIVNVSIKSAEGRVGKAIIFGTDSEEYSVFFREGKVNYLRNYLGLEGEDAAKNLIETLGNQVGSSSDDEKPPQNEIEKTRSSSNSKKNKESDNDSSNSSASAKAAMEKIADVDYSKWGRVFGAAGIGGIKGIFLGGFVGAITFLGMAFFQMPVKGAYLAAALALLTYIGQMMDSAQTKKEKIEHRQT